MIASSEGCCVISDPMEWKHLRRGAYVLCFKCLHQGLVEMTSGMVSGQYGSEVPGINAIHVTNIFRHLKSGVKKLGW